VNRLGLFASQRAFDSALLRASLAA